MRSRPLTTHLSAVQLVRWLISGWFLLVMGACSAQTSPAAPRELRVFNWEDYFAPDTLNNFQREFGIRVTLDTFRNEEEMLAAMQSQPGRFDVAIASGSMVATLRQLELLGTLDMERIANFVNIMQQFRGLPFDPMNRYSVPYLWGTTGLAVNKEYIPATADTWALLWEPAYRGRIAMLNEPQEVLGAALLTLGHPLNSRDSQHLEQAWQKLLEQRPLLAGYVDPVSIVEGLLSERLWAAQAYSGDALKAADYNPRILYIVPREGAALWVHNLVMPVGARHREEAEAFINYILRPDVAGDIVNYLYYASPNQAAQPFIQKEILVDASVYPAPETLDRLEHYQPLDEETGQALNRIWAQLLNP